MDYVDEKHIDDAISVLEDGSSSSHRKGRVVFIVVLLLVAAVGATVWWLIIRTRNTDVVSSRWKVPSDSNGIPCAWSALHMNPLQTLLKSDVKEFKILLGIPDPSFGVLRVVKFNKDKTISLDLKPSADDDLSENTLDVNVCNDNKMLISGNGMTLLANERGKTIPCLVEHPVGCGSASNYVLLNYKCDGPSGDEFPNPTYTNDLYGTVVRQAPVKAWLCVKSDTIATTPDVRFLEFTTEDSADWEMLVFMVSSPSCIFAPSTTPPKALPPALAGYPALFELLFDVPYDAKAASCPITLDIVYGATRPQEQSYLIVYLSSAGDSTKYIAAKDVKDDDQTRRTLTQVNTLEEATLFVLTYVYVPRYPGTMYDKFFCFSSWTLQEAGTDSYLSIVPAKVFDPNTLKISGTPVEHADVGLIRPHMATCDIRFRIGLNFCTDVTWNKNVFPPGECFVDDNIVNTFEMVGTTCVDDVHTCASNPQIPAYALVSGEKDDDPELQLTRLSAEKVPPEKRLRLQMHIVKNAIQRPIPPFPYTNNNCAFPSIPTSTP